MQIYKLFIFSLLACCSSFAQTHQKLNNYPFENIDVHVVVMPFGMENPIVIGTVSNSGNIQFDFPKELKNISKEDKESESSKLWYTVFSPCDNGQDMVSEKDNIFSFDTGVLSLSTKDNPYAGVITLVSDENLIPWIEDSGYMEPILASYYAME